MKSPSRILLTRLLALLAIAMLSVPAMPADHAMRVAVVFQGSASSVAFAETAFWTRLRELGWVEGKNVVAAKRYADGDLERLPALVADVLSSQVDVLVAAGNRGAVAAKNATKTIPIVGAMSDAVGAGLVTSLAQPGGNLTGVSISNADEIPTKLVELVHEAIPERSVFAVIVNPDNPITEKTLGHISRSAVAQGLTHIVLSARRAEDYPAAIKEARQRAQAAIITADAVSSHNRELIARLAEKHRRPTLAWASEFVAFTVTAALIFHRALGDPNQFVHFLKNLAIAGGLLHVAAIGAGAFSLDGYTLVGRRSPA